MYEVWLGANILWELAWMHAAWVLPLAALVLILALVALLRRGRRPGARPIGIAAMVTGALATLLLAPAFTRSSLAEVTYLLDWLVLLAIAAVVGAVCAIVACGLAALLPARDH